MYKWIDNIINDIYSKYNTNNIYELLDNYNIKIERVEPNNVLLQNNDSLYVRNFWGIETIFIRNDINECLEKFILRHEFAHAILHNNIYIAAFNINFVNKNKYEKQANYFALKTTNTEYDEVQLEGMSLDQVASYIEVPSNQLYQFNYM